MFLINFENRGYWFIFKMGLRVILKLLYIWIDLFFLLIEIIGVVLYWGYSFLEYYILLIF